MIDPLWIRQARAVLALELRKTLFSSRAALLYLLALAPIGLSLLAVLVQLAVGDGDFFSVTALTQEFYPGLFVVIYRGLLYIGCVWTFMNLFRGDVMDRSLHFYFLAPIRREVLVAGKFLSGFVATSLFFSICAVACRFILYAYHGIEGVRYLMTGAGLAQTFAYVGVIVLACLGYGAVFMLVGLFLKNPIIPAFLIFCWEFINPFLPSLLKKLSVVFYVDALLPVRMAGSAFAVVADPVPLWLAVPGFLLFTAGTLLVAGLRIRHMEIAYSVE